MKKVRKIEVGGSVRDAERRGTDRRRKSGATFLEYALLVALIGIVGAVGVMKYGKAISKFFSVLGEKTTEVTPKTTGN